MRFVPSVRTMSVGYDHIQSVLAQPCPACLTRAFMRITVCHNRGLWTLVTSDIGAHWESTR